MLIAYYSKFIGSNKNLILAIYDVEIKSTDLSDKLKLRGVYKLSVSTENIELLNSKTYEQVIKWPLHFLRK